MLEEILIIALREVGPRMGPARLPSQQRRIGNRLGYVKHEIKLERAHDFCVERAASIFNDDVLEPFSKSSQRPAGLLHLLFVTIDSRAFLHRFLHLLANGCDSFLSTILPQELTIQTPLLVRSQRLGCRRSRSRNVRGVGGSSATCTSPENQQLGQRVGTQPVGAIKRDARGFSGGVKSRESCFGVYIRRDTSHHVVHYRPHRNWLIDGVYADVLARQLSDKRKFLVDDFLTQVAQVEMHVMAVGTLKRAAFG